MARGGVAGPMKLRSRAQTTSTLTGLAIGMLLVGLGLPFVVGERLDDAPVVAGTIGVQEEPSADEISAPTADEGASPTETGDVTPPDTGVTQGPGGPGAPPTPSPTSSTGRTTAGGATAVGVTADTIRIGFALTDLGGAARLGVSVPGADAESQRRAYQVFVDEVNERKLHSRSIEPIYRAYDPVNNDAQLATCNRLAQDDKVFSVIGLAMFGPAVLCITEQHGLLLLNGDGLADEYYRRSRGLAFTSVPGKARTFRNQVGELHQLGLLRGKKLGVVTAEIGEDNVAVDEGLVPTLKSLGYRLAHYTKLGNDLGAAQAQIPVEVRQMQAAGVELIFLGTNVVFATNFVQQADSQGYRPGYTTNDFGGMTSDYYIASMPTSFRGLGVTSTRVGEWRTGQPEPATDRNCREAFERRTGERLARDNATYPLVMVACNQVRIMARGIERVGPGLTIRGLSDALQASGAFPMANTPGGSFRPGKFDAPDQVRTAEADMSCRCWKPTGPFRPARY